MWLDEITEFGPFRHHASDAMEIPAHIEVCSIDFTDNAEYDR